MKIIRFDSVTNECVTFVDKSSKNIVSKHNTDLPIKIFHLDEKMSLFLFWYVQKTDYVFRYISFNTVGFDIEIRGVNLVTESLFSNLSLALEENNMHILRSYGKYTKLTVHKL